MPKLLRPHRGPLPFAVFNLAGDKDKARSDWRARFENRQPPTGNRDAKVVPIRAAATAADTTDILLYDEIGWYGITAKEFNTALAGITTPNICVRINSPGGSVFDGMAIYNALKTSPKNVTCVIDGLAASAASYIALAGKTVSIHESAMAMIHRAWGYAMGNAGDMTEMAKVLTKIDGEIAAIYAKQTGKSADDMLKLMAGESDGTWFNAQEAADLGLVDEIIKPDDTTEQNPVAEDDEASEGIDPDGNPCSCDESDPDYDPDCECDKANCAKARAIKAEQQKLITKMRMRLALADAG